MDVTPAIIKQIAAQDAYALLHFPLCMGPYVTKCSLTCAQQNNNEIPVYGRHSCASSLETRPAPY